MNTEKEKKAIQILQTFEPQEEPYWLCYSGGKDSDVISILAELSGVKYKRYHSLTTVDSPVTMQYIKSQPDVIIEKARWPDGRHKTMSNLIEHKGMLPTRLIRFCCHHLKEQDGAGHLKITGVRAGESSNRAKNAGLIKVFGKPKTVEKIAEKEGAKYNNNNKAIVMNFDNAETRRTVEQCYRTTSTMVNPIIDWSDSDVWEFLKHYGCESNPEYQCGMMRIGCIGCPMAERRRRRREFQLYPKYFGMYWRACGRAMSKRVECGLDKRFDDVAHNMNWWLEYTDFADFVRDYAEIMEINGIEVPKVEKRQLSLFDELEV